MLAAKIPFDISFFKYVDHSSLMMLIMASLTKKKTASEIKI